MPAALPYLYDAGALIAAQKNDRRMWNLHHEAIANGVKILVPIEVVAQVWRGGPRQALLARLLSSCVIDELSWQTAKEIGTLLGRSRTTDVIDAGVAVRWIRHSAVVFTSDPQDLTHLYESACEVPAPQLIVV